MTATLIRLGSGALCSTALPVTLLLWLRCRRRAKLTPFFVGALVFIVFALFLEPLAHWFFLLSDNALSHAINESSYLYALYSALAAGIFEETGRYVASRFLLVIDGQGGR